MWSILVYLVVAAVVVFLSIKLSDYVDLLDKKTNLSGALLGGILLAAVTSLPELFTSITSTIFLRNNSYVMGNILGSDIFNITLFAIVYFIFFGKMAGSKINKIHLLTLGLTGLCYVIVTIASFVFDFRGILWGWFNPLSLGLLLVYAFSIWKTPKEEEPDEKEDTSKLTVKQVVILFIVFAILLIGASIGVTYCTDWVSAELHLSSTFGGALFLGVATSLPEMTATINLCRKKNFNAAYGNILGSCVFNFFILALSDVLSFRSFTTLYTMNQSCFLLIICGAFTIIVAVIGLLPQIIRGAGSGVGARIFYYVIATLLLGSYVTFLALSNIDLSLPFAPFA